MTEEDYETPTMDSMVKAETAAEWRLAMERLGLLQWEALAARHALRDVGVWVKVLGHWQKPKA